MKFAILAGAIVFVTSPTVSPASAAQQKPPPKFDYNTCVAKLQKSGAAAREAAYRCSRAASGTMAK